MGANWALGLQQGPNAGDRFAAAFDQGMQQNAERAKKAAMAALMADPNNRRAMEALARLDPNSAMQFKQQQTEQMKAQLAQHQDSILKGAEILRQFQPKDQATYTQALQAAQMAGIDVSQVPQQFDPQYVDGVVKLADTFAPQPQHQGQLVPFTPGGGVARINPQTGQLETLVAPNPGGQQAGAPVNATPPVMTDEQMRQLMNGGQSQSGSGGFPN